jgi:thiol-disulfide isomerase/thioredoxin
MRSTGRTVGRAASFVAATTIVLTACTGTSSGPNFRYHGSTRVGQMIPAAQRQVAGIVTGPLLAGGQFTLAAQAGRVTVLNFWGSWCFPCQAETPQFDALYRELKPSGVEFVGLDVKEANRDLPLSFIRDNHISFPNVYDPASKTATQLGHMPREGVPWTVLIDKQLKVAAVYAGPQQPADLRPVLERLAAEAAPPTPGSAAIPH